MGITHVGYHNAKMGVGVQRSYIASDLQSLIIWSAADLQLLFLVWVGDLQGLHNVSAVDLHILQVSAPCSAKYPSPWLWCFRLWWLKKFSLTSVDSCSGFSGSSANMMRNWYTSSACSSNLVSMWTSLGLKHFLSISLIGTLRAGGAQGLWKTPKHTHYTHERERGCRHRGGARREWECEGEAAGKQLGPRKVSLNVLHRVRTQPKPKTTTNTKHSL